MHAAFWYGIVVGFVAGFVTCTGAGLWVLHGVADLNSAIGDESDDLLHGQINAQ